MENDEPKCWTISTPRARKDHRCCECGGLIKAGQSYHVCSGIWDRPKTYKTCFTCECLRARMEERILDSIPFEHLLDYLVESSKSDKALLAEWVSNAEQRGGRVEGWIKDYLADAPPK